MGWLKMCETFPEMETCLHFWKQDDKEAEILDKRGEKRDDKIKGTKKCQNRKNRRRNMRRESGQGVCGVGG
jgi:hypothetical protein